MRELKVGIVGAAGRGKSFFSPFIHNPRTKIEALCDIDEEKLEQTASENGISVFYMDFEEMLEKSDLDIVLIGTPMPLHVPQSIMALKKNINVICEVPAAVSLDQARELVAACGKSAGRYMMAENYCYMRPNILVREIARAGLFGEMYFGEGDYIHELKGLNEITKWRRRWQTGINGCTYPTHSLGPVLQWMEDRVVSVSCTGTSHHYKDPQGGFYENEDSTLMLCRTSRGGLVKIRLDMLSNRPHNMTYYALQGTTGCYEASRGLGDEPKIWLRSRSDAEEMRWMPLASIEEEFLPEKWLHPSEEAVKSGHGGGDYMEIEDFVEAIVNDTPIPVGIHEAMDMTIPGLISQESISQGSAWLPVPNSRDW
jgi:predicted dehydrogenase